MNLKMVVSVLLTNFGKIDQIVAGIMIGVYGMNDKDFNKVMGHVQPSIGFSILSGVFRAIRMVLMLIGFLVVLNYILGV